MKYSELKQEILLKYLQLLKDAGFRIFIPESVTSMYITYAVFSIDGNVGMVLDEDCLQQIQKGISSWY